MRQIVQALVVSRIVYGIPYHQVNRTQKLALERLLNEARRLVPGLPRYSRLEAMKSCSLIKRLDRDYRHAPAHARSPASFDRGWP